MAVERPYFKIFGSFQQRSKLLILIANNFKTIIFMHFNVILFYKKNEKKARLSLYGFYVRGLLCDIMKKTKSRLI